MSTESHSSNGSIVTTRSEGFQETDSEEPLQRIANTVAEYMLDNFGVEEVLIEEIAFGGWSVTSQAPEVMLCTFVLPPSEAMALRDMVEEESNG